MPKRVSRFAQTEQPIHWIRAFICGVVSSVVMMGFMDNFYMLGLTPFNFEIYLGSLLRGTMNGQQNWILGFFANMMTGGIFGFLYAYGFEYIFKKSSSRLGTALGLLHAIIALAAFFPFFNILHQEVGTGLYPHFGFFGSGLGAPTPILLLMGHLLFGASMGMFYGPVRAYRVRARYYEPGESGMPGDVDIVGADEFSELTAPASFPRRSA